MVDGWAITAVLDGFEEVRAAVAEPGLVVRL
jgi:hypothetical protein